MSDAAAEIAFESLIAEYLAAHGWLYSRNDAGGPNTGHLETLQADGRLRRVGSRKTGRWQVLS